MLLTAPIFQFTKLYKNKNENIYDTDIYPQILMKSDALNCQNSMLELLANSFAQKGALWLLYGKMEMSSLSSQLLLRLHTLDTVPHSGYSGESTCLALCCVANAFIQEVFSSIVNHMFLLKI